MTGRRAGLHRAGRGGESGAVDLAAGKPALTEADLDGVLAWTAVRVGRRVERVLTDLLTEQNLTPVQFGVLAQLEVHQALSQAELARAIGIRAQSTREVVAAMARRGLLERLGPGGRGRRTAIELTSAGRALLAAAWPLVAGACLPSGVDEEIELNAKLLGLLQDLGGDVHVG